MVTQQLALAEVQAFGADLHALGSWPRQVIVFGAFARNEPPEGSGIDVAVVAEAFSGFSPQDARLTSRARHVAVEPHPYRPEDFTN